MCLKLLGLWTATTGFQEILLTPKNEGLLCVGVWDCDWEVVGENVGKRRQP